MFIENLFNFGNIKIQKFTEFHYAVSIPRKFYAEQELKILRLFFKNFQVINILDCKKEVRFFHFIIRWRHRPKFSYEDFTEKGGENNQ
ncbi:MAG TPA: hypothetical protein DCE80_14310 [Ignavibacteriales bacterium]|nr:hypothetical protein [Ignavibacteriales bacterium]